MVLASNLKVLSLLAFFSSIHNHNLTETDTHPPVVLLTDGDGDGDGDAMKGGS